MWGLRKGQVVELLRKGFFRVDALHAKIGDGTDMPPSQHHQHGSAAREPARVALVDDATDKGLHKSSMWCEDCGAGRDKQSSQGVHPSDAISDGIMRLIAIPSGMVVRRYACGQDEESSDDYDDGTLSLDED
jgi:hypothetical protein